MKRKRRQSNQQALSAPTGRRVLRWTFSLLSTLSAMSVLADDTSTNAPPKLTPEQMFEGGETTYTNWVETSAGSFITTGDKARQQERLQRPGTAFGGIEDFHYQREVATNTVMTIDGRGIFDNHDYKLRLDVTREKVGYLRFNYSEFRTWSDGDGGFDPSSNSWYPLGRDALALDRGEFSFEGGLRLEEKPQITFKYTHNTRDGEKSSTIWGIAHPAGLPRGLSPSFYEISERADIFQLDLTHTIDKTDFGVGLRYDNGELDNALKITHAPGEAGFERKVTDRQGTTYDMFNVHAFSETWLTNNLMFSTGFSYSDLDTDFSGSRVYGSDFDVNYAPNSLNGFGYNALSGGSRLHEYVGDFNLYYKPTPTVAIIPSIRIQKEDTDATASGTETLSDFATADFTSLSERSMLDVRERIDIRYTGVTNWVFYARADFSEGDGNLFQSGGLMPINGIGIPSVESRTDDERFFQKYSLGTRWYPRREVTFDLGGYCKLNKYDYHHLEDSTPNDSPDRYPAYLVMQDFETYDANTRVAFRPLNNLTLATRYEFQLSHIHTKPDSISGLDEVESSEMTSHIIAEDLTWSPWTRLYLQAGVNYVLSDTRTPASDITEAILKAQNNYWTVNFSSTLVLDKKTDLKVNYFYYQADNYSDNSAVSVNYGTASREHGITATLVRRISSNLRWTLRYGFFLNRDDLSGGHADYDSHLLFSSIQYRF
jgi:hypothetical protein